MNEIIRKLQSDIDLAKYRVKMAEADLEKEKNKDEQDLYNLNAFGRGYRTAMLNAEKERLHLLEDYMQILQRSEQSA
jgi:hypothetical protein